MSGSIALTWNSPHADADPPQTFKATRGEAIAVTFSRKSGSSRVLGVAAITLRFSVSPATLMDRKIAAPVDDTTFTASVGVDDTTAMAARRWYFQAFDETNSELLSWGWMQLLENTDLVD